MKITCAIKKIILSIGRIHSYLTGQYKSMLFFLKNHLAMFIGSLNMSILLFCDKKFT